MRTAEHMHKMALNNSIAYPPFTFSRATIAHRDHPDHNEDAILVDTQRGLAAVFDGVGGNEAGEVASHTAARVIQRAWKQYLSHRQQGQISPSFLEGHVDREFLVILRHFVTAAHDHIRVEGFRRRHADGMPRILGTTIALAVLSHQQNNYTLTCAHVGDSRIYLLRSEKTIQRLTSDDGYLSILLKEKTITEEDAFRIDQATHYDTLSEMERELFKRRNSITQALGDIYPPIIHIEQMPLLSGDRILLCSDGIHDNLTDKEIEEILQGSTRTNAAKTLVQQALRRSNKPHKEAIRAKADDMSAIVITSNF
jgi:serine/threonine protein phosphatase PrpC